MADQAKMNGPAEGAKFIDTLDTEDPEYIRQKNRPAEIKEDVKQMDARRRVNQILTSQAFRDELERIVSEQLQAGTGPISATALQQISELLLPQHRFNQGGFFSKASGAVIPIADIKGVDSLNYERGEKILRNKVASCYRLLDIFGWSNFFSNLITCRISQDAEHFLLAPHGMMAHEVTASSLIKVDMQGHVHDPGSSTLPANTQLFLVHASLHAFRPDLKCLVQLRCSQALALSSLKDGIVLLTPEAASLGQISYAEFVSDDFSYFGEQLGPQNKVLVLRNFGVIVGGESVEEAFLNARYMMSASDTQLALMSLGPDHLLVPSEEAMAKAAQLSTFIPTSEDGKKKYRKGEMEFEALMRHLDNAGFRTNHLYRDPQFKRTLRPERSNSEVEIPPATVSSTYDDEGRLLSPLRLHEMQRKAHRSDWLNTPNKYTKEEMAEIGTATPKKITKWVPESSPGSKAGQPFKVEGTNQFAPQGADPKELKLRHQAIRREYYEDKIDAGPQSKILEGVTWDEAAQKNKSGNTSDTVVVVGAASKGIIQKDHRHNVQMYKSTFASNPFDNMTEDEIVRYKEDIAHGTKIPDESDAYQPGSDGKLISTEERLQHVRQTQQEATPQEDANGEQLASPAKSMSSGEGTLDERSSREGSPTKEAHAEASTSEKTGEKKKKKFRMPSFSKQKKDKKSAKQSQV
jgi:adducin